ncbi:histidine kinase [Azoarcus sp. DD4]|uniref:sensor histidine kinase n=1 Tax=Azoarcus sp. DD4 TaxID=2027405 RepID=UPI001F0DD193|nr:histidine kinase [Azoarcus sp. DD4]
MNPTPAPSAPTHRQPAAASAAAFDLQRALLIRIVLFGLAATGIGLAALGWLARQAALSDLEPTGAIVQQLLSQDQPRLADPFNREQIAVDLAVLAPLARRLAFCVEVEDLWGRVIARDCMAPAPALAGTALPASGLAALAGDAGVARFGLLRPPGVTVGEIRVAPHWAAELSGWLGAVGVLALAWLALAALAVVLIAPVRRALRPADRILAAIGQLEAGDTTVRLPAFELREFRRIGEDFNSLARQLGETRAAERRLATGLLDAREAERRHLARELHDDMGQHLTSLRAEAAFLRHVADGDKAALLPSLDIIETSLAQLHESVQGIVQRLRPPGLDAFGLGNCLAQLVRDARRRPDGTPVETELAVRGDLAALPGEFAVHVYRIVQEGLTNALRHACANRVTVAVACDGGRIEVEVVDDGLADGSAMDTRGGHGLSGMAERVAALGGSVALAPLHAGGMRLAAGWPLPEARP